MEGQLNESTVIRAGQRPAMMLYVPLNVFLLECALFFFAVRFLGLLGLATLVLHVVPVVLTGADLFWTRTLAADFWFYWIASNKGLKGKKAVTFSPAPVKEHLN
jgi:type IV secretory pathway VirB3-like protein